MTYTAQQAATAIGFHYRRVNRLALRHNVGTPVTLAGRIIGREFSKRDLGRLKELAAEFHRGWHRRKKKPGHDERHQP